MNINKIKQSIKFYNSLKTKTDLTSFEKLFIKSYELDNYDEIETLVKNSKYATATDYTINFSDNIYIEFVYNNFIFGYFLDNNEVSIDITTDTCEIEDYDERIKISLHDYNDLNEVFKVLLEKTDKVYEKFSNPNRINKSREEFFSKDEIKNHIVKYNRTDKMNFYICAFIGLFFIVLLLFIPGETGADQSGFYILFSLFILIDVFISLNSIIRLKKINYFFNKMSLDEGIKELQFKPTKVELFLEGKNRSNPYNSLCYIILYNEVEKYLVVLPETIIVKKQNKLDLVNKLKSLDLKINYYDNSHIITLKDSEIYEIIKQFKREIEKSRKK